MFPGSSHWHADGMQELYCNEFWLSGAADIDKYIITILSWCPVVGRRPQDAASTPAILRYPLSDGTLPVVV